MSKLTDVGTSALKAGNKASTFGAGMVSSIRKGVRESMTSKTAMAGGAAGAGIAFYDEYYDNTNRNNVKTAGNAALLGGIGYGIGAGLHGTRSLTTGIWTSARSMFAKKGGTTAAEV